jgi:LPXTG-motif cell wall-anchored protein
VFANEGSCTDAEAEVVLDVRRDHDGETPNRVILIKGNASRDHFTLTYTDAGGNTSELSGCESVEDHPDTDGDGSVDPLDGLIDVEDDPTAAILVTDDEQLLLLGTNGGGELENVAVVDDPAPDGHPAGWSLPHGVIKFRVAGLAPGGATVVVMMLLTDSAPIAGSSYWKYGPPTPGDEPSWYSFNHDAATDTGAIQGEAVDVPGVGFRQAFVLRLRDGARGDHDGGMNGTITDPGGPVLGAPDEAPSAPPDAPPIDLTAPVAAGLPRTGSSSGGLAALAGLVLAVGLALVLATRRRRSV